MPEEARKRGSKDRGRINVREDYEVLYWTRELGVDQRTLTSAVKAVGPSVETVREYLQSREEA